MLSTNRIYQKAHDLHFELQLPQEGNLSMLPQSGNEYTYQPQLISQDAQSDSKNISEELSYLIHEYVQSLDVTILTLLGMEQFIEGAGDELNDEEIDTLNLIIDTAYMALGFLPHSDAWDNLGWGWEHDAYHASLRQYLIDCQSKWEGRFQLADLIYTIQYSR